MYDKRGDYPIEKYIERQTGKYKQKYQRRVKQLEVKGFIYYTKERIEAIAYCKDLTIT